jgi:Bifunctional DNA primase/polymerase, N-terminal
VFSKYGAAVAYRQPSVLGLFQAVARIWNFFRGDFSDYQPAYAERGIATFPLRDDKRPAVKAWNKMGLRASRELAGKFTDANALGFVTNKRSGVTVLDIDSTDEQVLADALVRHGDTPIVVQTASRKAHAYYRHHGERRRIRPWDDLPIDLLGVGGLVVAPPTLVTKGQYEFIQGSLDDIDRLPAMRGLSPDMYVDSPSIAPDESESDCIAQGTRSATLWRFCMSHASSHRVETGKVIDRSYLIDAARKLNGDCVPPLPDSEVIAVASSAWGYEVRGSNWFGTGRRVVASHDEVDELSPDAFYLLARLRRHHWRRKFAVANGMAESLGWHRVRLSKARTELETKGKIKMLRRGNQWQGAALPVGTTGLSRCSHLSRRRSSLLRKGK